MISSKLKKAAKSYVEALKFGAKLKGGTNKEIDADLIVAKYETKADDNITLNAKGVSNEFSYTRVAHLEIASGTNQLYDKETGVWSHGLRL